MSRDDEIAVIQRADGKWWIGHVMAGNYHLYEDQPGQYDKYEDALVAAHNMDERWGRTEYGVNVQRHSNFTEKKCKCGAK